MNKDTLKKGIAISKEIEGAENNKSALHKLYSKKENLSYEDIEKLFTVASYAIEFCIERLNDDLKKI